MAQRPPVTLLLCIAVFALGILSIVDIAKVHKKRDFLRPVHKKVKTVTIFVGKKRSVGFACLMELKKTGLVSQ